MKTNLPVVPLIVIVLTVLLGPGVQAQKTQYHHYKLVDLGTLGGPNSFIPFEGTNSLNRRGNVIVQAHTPIPDPYNPFCFQPLYGGRPAVPNRRALSHISPRLRFGERG